MDAAVSLGRLRRGLTGVTSERVSSGGGAIGSWDVGNGGCGRVQCGPRTPSRRTRDGNCHRCNAVIARTIDRPRPLPRLCPRAKRSPTRESWCSGKSGPSSSTAISTPLDCRPTVTPKASAQPADWSTAEAPFIDFRKCVVEIFLLRSRFAERIRISRAPAGPPSFQPRTMCCAITRPAASVAAPGRGGRNSGTAPRRRAGPPTEGRRIPRSAYGCRRSSANLRRGWQPTAVREQVRKT